MQKSAKHIVRLRNVVLALCSSLSEEDCVSKYKKTNADVVVLAGMRDPNHNAQKRQKNVFT